MILQLQVRTASDSDPRFQGLLRPRRFVRHFVCFRGRFRVISWIQVLIIFERAFYRDRLRSLFNFRELISVEALNNNAASLSLDSQPTPWRRRTRLYRTRARLFLNVAACLLHEREHWYPNTTMTRRFVWDAGIAVNRHAAANVIGVINRSERTVFPPNTCHKQQTCRVVYGYALLTLVHKRLSLPVETGKNSDFGVRRLVGAFRRAALVAAPRFGPSLCDQDILDNQHDLPI